MCLIPSLSFSQLPELKFTHYSLDEGLSNSGVNFVSQDKEGFIWVGTYDGLNKFDGYDFTDFRRGLNDKNSLSNNLIHCFLQDDGGNIWIGTRDGLNRINAVDKKITSFFHDKADTTSLSHSRINTLTKDVEGNIWVGTAKGINRFNSKTGTFEYVFKNKHTHKCFFNEDIHELYVDDENNLWIKAGNCVGFINLNTLEVKNILTLNYEENSIVNRAFSFFKSTSNKMYIGTNEGMFVYNYATKKTKSFIHNPDDKKSLSNNIVTSIIQDKEDFLWIGTNDGLNKFDEKSEHFYTYKHEINNSKSLSENGIQALYLDNSGVVWVSTLATGVNKFNPQTQDFNFIKIPNSDTRDAYDKNIWAIVEDKNGNVWYGTNHGVYVVNKDKTRFFGVDEVKNKGLSQEFVLSLYIDSQGNLWIGSFFGVSILKAKDVNAIFTKTEDVTFIHVPTKESVMTFFEDVGKQKMYLGVYVNGVVSYDMKFVETPNEVVPVSLFGKIKDFDLGKVDVSKIIKEKEVFWIGSDKGLLKYSFSNNTLTHVINVNDKKNTFSNKLMNINKVNDSILWMTTYGGGIHKFNTNTEVTKQYTIKDGLPSNSTYDILVDNEEKLWISTNKGLSKLESTTEVLTNYDEGDGLQGSEFNQGASFKGKGGKLYFGGTNGLNIFDPENIKDNQVVPEVFLADFTIFNKSVEIGKTSKELNLTDDNTIILKESITNTEKLDLSYRHSVFSIIFSASNYTSPKQNIFEYKLEGFDENWAQVKSNNRRATYTNLDPGKYTFKVRSGNKNGVFQKEPRILKIAISPPYWRTYWFYGLCIMAMGSFVVFVIRGRLNKMKLKYFKSQDEHKTSMLKEIHHRVKNNLQIVNSLLRMQSSSIDDKKVTQIFDKVQSRVLAMANLHERMYKTEDLKMISAKEYLGDLVASLVKTYKVSRDIKLTLDIEDVKFDMETLVPLGLILNELIINSLKYAFNNRDEGEISVVLKKGKKSKQYVLITSDDGIGIGTEIKAGNMGTKLIRSFVRQLDGSIKQLEQPGTCFQIIFKEIVRN